MISFAAKVKEEVIRVERTERANKAQLAAILQFLSTMSISNRGLSLIIKTENPDIARMILALLKQYYEVKAELSMIQKVKLKKNRVYIIRVLSQAREILEDLGIWTKEGLTDYPDYLLDDECAKAYLAGCFLAAGSVNDPKKPDYHLEIACNTDSLAHYIITILKQLNMPGKMIQRRKQYVVYIKSADYINDFIARIGAVDASFDFADIKISRDWFNSLTRLENCALANETKSLQAGNRQVKNIENIKDKLETLDPKLKEVALLRLEFPEASLNELATKYNARTGSNLSKSGMKHRLEKIENLAGKVEHA